MCASDYYFAFLLRFFFLFEVLQHLKSSRIHFSSSVGISKGSTVVPEPACLIVPPLSFPFSQTCSYSEEDLMIMKDDCLSCVCYMYTYQIFYPT